jgi:hypothetical protein
MGQTVYVLEEVYCFLSVPVAARSKAWFCGRSLAGTCGSEFLQKHGSLCLVSVVLSGRGLCVGLITRPEESYRVWCA